MDKEDVVHINNGIFLSHKREWNNAICSNMCGSTDDPTKQSKSNKDKCHMIPLICEIWTNDINELIYKMKMDIVIENKCIVTTGERGEE